MCACVCVRLCVCVYTTVRSVSTVKHRTECMHNIHNCWTCIYGCMHPCQHICTHLCACMHTLLWSSMYKKRCLCASMSLGDDRYVRMIVCADTLACMRCLQKYMHSCAHKPIPTSIDVCLSLSTYPHTNFKDITGHFIVYRSAEKLKTHTWNLVEPISINACGQLPQKATSRVLA